MIRFKSDMPSNVLAPGTRIREYEIVQEIGRGGMGVVYRARHVYLRKERAIKVIHPYSSKQSDFTERFIREARVLSELVHPNLVRLFEFGELEPGAFYIVMELIQGESVRERIGKQGRIDVAQAVRIIREAASGLGSAHKMGIIHRDISPDNLMLVVDESGTEMTKVIDFGIAKGPFDSQELTQTGQFVGKLEYCSPEQCGILGDGEIDHRADIYSLGITSYFILSGKLPFYSPTPQGFLLKHATEKPKEISSHFRPGEFPKSLERIIEKTLAKERNDRYFSMDEFVRDLDAFTPAAATMSLLTVKPAEAGALPETAPPFVMSQTTSSAPSGWRSMRLTWSVAPLVVVAIFVGLVWQMQHSSAPHPSAQPPPTEYPRMFPKAMPPVASQPSAPVAVSELIQLIIRESTKSRSNHHSIVYVRLMPLMIGIKIPSYMAEPTEMPLLIKVPPGEYSVEITGKDLKIPVVKTIRVERGKPNDFDFELFP